MAESDAKGNILWREHYSPFGKQLDKSSSTNDIGFTGHEFDRDTGLTYMQARYYDPLIGRFYSNDPVDALGHIQRGNPVHGFNRYAYANNNPYKYTDPDGKFAFVIPLIIPFVGGSTVTVSPALVSAGVAAGAVLSMSGDSDSSPAPDLPSDLVGDQSDSRAGPNKSGNRHTSGPLTPENSGTGDFETDLETLAGETRPAGPGDSTPPGSLIGENGFFGRPENSSGGASIDIPANGDKPHETLHYDREQN